MDSECVDVHPSAEELVENREVVKCVDCNRVFANRGALRMHTVKTHRRMLNSTDLPLHSWTQRTGRKQKQRFHCPSAGCSKTYGTRQSLTQHYQKVHCEKSYECVECGAKFALERDLRYHGSKLCASLRNSLVSTERQVKCTTRLKRPSKPQDQCTQTDPFRIRLYVARCVDNFQEMSTQTNLRDDQTVDYRPEQQPMTSDFGVQYEQPGYSRMHESIDYAAGVLNYDQATTYEPVYYSSQPERVDVNVGTGTDEGFPLLSEYLNNHLDYADVPTQTPPMYDSNLWLPRSPSQTHIATQTALSVWTPECHSSGSF